MKDNFSVQADKYAQYRPAYPPELFDYLNSMVHSRQNAWDCGTGNGQVASELAKTFDQVFATDISQPQLDNAVQAANIIYSRQAAEKVDFDSRMFDLIVVAQAIHWFDFEQFYGEVRRTAKPHAWLGVVGYGKLEISEPLDQIIGDFYTHVVGAYWDRERQYIDEGYRTIPFPFDEIPAPGFVHRQAWTLEHLTGYLNTWSAVRHFIEKHGFNPVVQLQSELERLWGHAPTREVRFPILLRMGRVTHDAAG